MGACHERASAIVTNRGGRTCHAIIARELGVPAIVGCGDATTKIQSGSEVTVDCSGDTGRVLKGLLKYTKSNTIGRDAGDKNQVNVERW